MSAILPIIGGMVKVLPNGRKVAIYKQADTSGLGSPLVAAYQDEFGNTTTIILIDPMSEADWAHEIDVVHHGIGNWMHAIEDWVDAHLINFFGLYLTDPITNATPYSMNALNLGLSQYSTIDWPVGGVSKWVLLA